VDLLLRNHPLNFTLHQVERAVSNSFEKWRDEYYDDVDASYQSIDFLQAVHDMLLLYLLKLTKIKQVFNTWL
jgi:hypothetical protein